MQIDPEFRDLLPALSAMEIKTLEASIESEGQRDPIIVWANHDDTIIDGHNRYAICQRLGLKPKIKALKFEDRAEVLKWIYNNQQGRRNITPEQLSYIRGKVYNLRKQSRGGDRKSKGQNVPLIGRTSLALAAEFDVDEKTIRRDAKFAAACDADPEKKKAMLAPKTKQKNAKAKGKAKPTNGHDDGGWKEALEQATRKPSIGKEDIAKFKGIADLVTCRKGLSILSQANGFIVDRLGKDKYRVRHAVVLPLDETPQDDAALLSTVKKEMRELLSRLTDSNFANFQYEECLKFVKRTVKALEHVR